MADMVLNFGRDILNKDTGKSKAPAIDVDQHNDPSSSTERSGDQTQIFMTPAPQATGSEQPGRAASKRQRPSQQMAEFRQERKRARTAAATPEQFVRPPRPFAEDVEDQDDGLSDQSGRHDRRAVSRQPSNETEFTSNAAGKRPDVGPSRIMSDPLQGSRNAQPGKIPIPTTTLSRPGSHNAAGQPGPRATPSAGPASTTVDLTEDDDEDEENNGIPPGHTTAQRTGITAPTSEFGEAVRTLCAKKCEAAASTLSRRTDDEGKHIFHRCVGTAALLKSAKTLAIVRTLMANDVKDVLVDANTTLSRYRNKYNNYFEGEDDGLQKFDLKRILDRQDARVEKVEQARNWRKDMVNDLREMPLVFLRRNITNDR